MATSAIRVINLNERGPCRYVHFHGAYIGGRELSHLVYERLKMGGPRMRERLYLCDGALREELSAEMRASKGQRCYSTLLRSLAKKYLITDCTLVMRNTTVVALRLRSLDPPPPLISAKACPY